MKRFETRAVNVGGVGIGGDNPIRIQSMTSCDTKDVSKSFEQILKLQEAGCELVRLTVQGMKEVEAVEKLRNLLAAKHIDIPLIADIHFLPQAALAVVDFVDKVRINPGNFADKRALFKTQVYDDQTYLAELDRVEQKFSPLVEKCKKAQVALRIGTNHGSLSDRVMNRYGDTPYGMVESAFEFARICRKMDFHDLIFSMKSSNTQVMIEAYRLLVKRQIELGWQYPLHIGVTEAGFGLEGRVKSSIGIGSLLLEGIGDTLRVSLTEDPWHEVPVCRKLVAMAGASKPESFRLTEPRAERPASKPHCHPRGSVWLRVYPHDFDDQSFESKIDCQIQLKRLIKGPAAPDGLIVDQPYQELKALEKAGLPIWTISQAIDNGILPEGTADLSTYRQQNLSDPPLGLYSSNESLEDVVIQASAQMGLLLTDRWINGIVLQTPQLTLSERGRLSFAILQGSRLRSTRTEFISCPSCGRTLFDIQAVTLEIAKKTSHLVGVKIAIMGCIVNGPGEMADADFGYVGSKPGKIDLYIGKTRIEKDIDHSQAVDRLIDLIKAQGRWQEPISI